MTFDGNHPSMELQLSSKLQFTKIELDLMKLDTEDPSLVKLPFPTIHTISIYVVRLTPAEK